jgi:hypothetical protein
MNWNAIGAVGEILGAAVVVVTLGYLAIQLRLARGAYEIQSTYASHEYYSRWRTAIIENPELRQVITKSNRGELLTGEEELAISTLTQEVFLCVAVSVATNERKKVLSDSSPQIDYLVRMFTDNPGLVAYWHSYKGLISSTLPEFISLVDQKLLNSRASEEASRESKKPSNKAIEADA